MLSASGGAGGGAGGAKPDKQHDALFNELMQECKHSAPGARLSARLRTALERLHPETRRAVVSRAREGCAPLFVAARRGNVEIVEYLVHVCAAELEQRGLYEVPDERSVHTVTPLWAAAVAGRLEVVRVLAEAGADVDADSDSGSTPVRSACFMTHVAVVRYLVGRGADVTRPNHNGGTCLINAVQSAPLCAFLLQHGADVNATDMQLKTALHYAIQEHRVETARLLLLHGADPLLRSRAGDDALTTACLKGASAIVSLLLARSEFCSGRAASGLELLGATLLDEFNDMPAALHAWRKATVLRTETGVPKEATLALEAAGAAGALGAAREWRSLGELEALATDVDALRIQALLVAHRVLGPAHKDTVFRLMYRGASYADAFRYQRCIDLWSWALQIRIEKDTLLFTDTCHTACALTRLMLDARGGRLERARRLPAARDVTRLLRLLAAHLPPARAALAHQPQHRKQAETFDRALRCVTHLIYLLQAAAETDDERTELRKQVLALVAADVRSAHTGDTLLHLSVSRLNQIRSTYFADEVDAAPIFPSVRVVALLLQCGASARVRNEARSTPLHVAAIPYNYSTELMETLLAGGGHLDTPNKFGDSALELAGLNRDAGLRPLRHVGLRCLAARALLAAGRAPPARDPAAGPGPPPATELPATLLDFIDLHRK